MTRPEVVCVMQASVNGKIALGPDEGSHDRRRSGFSSAADFQFMRRLVAECDAVFIGWRSMEVERGAFRVADLRQDGLEPHWFVWSGSGHIDLNHGFWKQADIPKSACLSTALGEPVSIRPLAFAGGEDLELSLTGGVDQILEYLAESGIRRVALLGGGELNRLFWQADLVDRLALCWSPALVLGASLPTLVADPARETLQVRMSLDKLSQNDGFVFAEYVVTR